jgi:hypothetical protein
MTPAEVDEMARELARVRGERTIFHIMPRPRELDANASADAIASAVGLRPQGPAWAELDRDDAERIVEDVLHKDLAYGVEVVAPSVARTYVVRFTRALGPSRYFTSEWISDATFDRGVIAVGVDRTGIVWVRDED